MNDKLAIIFSEMENLLSRFLHHYQANRLEQLAELLDERRNDFLLDMEDESLLCRDYESAVEKLKVLAENRDRRMEKEILTMASPCYDQDSDSQIFRMSCDTYVYRVFKNSKDQKWQCQLKIKRIDARFSAGHDGLRISRLKWYTIQDMMPWTYKDTQNPGGFLDIKAPELPQRLKGYPEDSLAIRNLQNAFFERKFINSIELLTRQTQPEIKLEHFSDSEWVGQDEIRIKMEEILDLEARNNGCYMLLGLTGAPVIEIASDKDKADGAFLVQTFQVRAAAFGHKAEPYDLVRHICHLKASYRVENGIWKIQSMYLTKITELPIADYVSGNRYDKMSGQRGQWCLDSISLSGYYPEDAYLIENILNSWVFSCRRGELAKFYSQHMKNAGENAILHISSQGEKSRMLESEEDILGKLTSMDRQFTNLQYSYHTTTTPVIAISQDGLSAKGVWFDHSATNLSGTVSESDIIPYMVFVAKYVHEFKKKDGQWKLVHFYWEPLINLPDWRFNPLTSSGWVSQENPGNYPVAFRT